MKVFIIILNWNRPEDTVQCLESIEKLQVPKNTKLQVVIVDNGSTDNSIETLKVKCQKSNVKSKLILNKINLGFADGNNVGIKYALENGADYVLVLNNDTIADKDLVNELLTVAKDNPRIGAIAPQIYFAKGFEFHKKRYKKDELGKVIWAAGGEMDWDNVYGKNRGVDEVDRGQYDTVEEIDFASGACVLLNKKALNEVGSFDKDYFMYLEDVDLSMRMKRGGWKVLYAPKAKLWHKVAQSSAIGSGLNDYFITRNRLLFGIKYAPLRAKAALVKESIKFLLSGRKWQRIGVRDYYLRRFGRGSWK